MGDWKITRIVEDLGSPDADRWLVVYQVSTDVAPDGVFSMSLPKAVLNTYAALFEYDVTDPEQLDDLFDHVMSIPMMQDTLWREGRMAEQVKPFDVAPHAGRARLKGLIGELKAGKAQLKAAPAVALEIRGMPDEADPAENPKYILKRDMLARIEPDAVAKMREMCRAERQTRLGAKQ